MPPKFKVWIHIEEIEESTDSYIDTDYARSIGEFDSYEEAEALADNQ